MENLARYDCLMGRDMIARIPSFGLPVEELRVSVTEHLEDLLTNQKEILARPEEVVRYTRTSLMDNGEIIIFPGFKGNNPTVIDFSEDEKASELENTTPTKEGQVRALIQQKLEGCAAETVGDIDLELNRHREFKIKLIDPTHRPIHCKSRPIPHSIKHKVRTALFEQVAAGLIRPSTSEWASPLHIVIKSDGTIRITVDYRLVNNIIEFDPYPMPATRELYSELAEGNWFSTFDFYKAYNQIPTAEDSIKYTAFICEWGLFECPSMPQGIMTAAAWFQRCMDQVFQELVHMKLLRSYLDDIVLHTVTLAAHLEGAMLLIKLMKSGTLKVSLKKFELVKTEITFLGKVICRGKIKNVLPAQPVFEKCHYPLHTSDCSPV